MNLNKNNLTYKEFIQNIINTRGRHGCGKEYHERHHITPKCMGGDNSEENLIDLFAREHYEAHKLLALENPDKDGLQIAWFMMCHCTSSKYNKREKISSEEYEEAKKRFAVVISNKTRGKYVSAETREKISKANKGKIFSEETKRKLRENHADYSNNKHPMYGKHHTEEARRHIKEAAQNRSSEWHEKQRIAHLGMKHTEEWKKEMSERNKGKNNPNYGNHKLKGNTLNAKKVICDGIIFPSLTDCVKYYGLKSVGNFSCFLNGTKKMPDKWAKLRLSWYEEGEE